MAEFRLSEVARLMDGELQYFREDFTIRHYGFDSRCLADSQALFFALRSRRADGHGYVQDLSGRKQTAAVVNREYSETGSDIPLIRVSDPLAAAQKFAARIRCNFSDITYIGITGSIGKTTTKEFCHQILSGKFRVFRSPSNWNNWIGLPFSLMMMEGNEDYAVFELAMSSPGLGEIDRLSAILRPDIALVLNVYPVHLEYLRNLENIARAKMEIFNHQAEEGTGFINGDQELLVKMARRRKQKFTCFGETARSNQVFLKEVVREPGGYAFTVDYSGSPVRYHCGLTNRIQIDNLFAAVMVATHQNMPPADIQQAIGRIRSVEKRGTLGRRGGWIVIDESYNSNPRALERNLHWVADEYPEAKKAAVLGDMLELGEEENRYHLEAGRTLASLNYDRLVVVGPRARAILEGALAGGFDGSRAAAFEDARQAGRYLVSTLDPGEPWVILLKGSRGMKMERAVEELLRD